MKMKVKMVAKGTVTNPDGTTQEIELISEVPIEIDEEEKDNGDHIISSS